MEHLKGRIDGHRACYFHHILSLSLSSILFSSSSDSEVSVDTKTWLSPDLPQFLTDYRSKKCSRLLQMVETLFLDTIFTRILIKKKDFDVISRRCHFRRFVYFVVFVERGVDKRKSELHKQTSLAQATTSHQILSIISVTRDAK